MPLYNASGNVINSAFDVLGVSRSAFYDIDGNPIDIDIPPIEERTLVFEDNFNTFNAENWDTMTGAINTNYIQYYTPNNITVENGSLVFTARKEETNGFSWSSGGINSQKRQSFQYGRFEAKIKLPNISGSFPAFWLLGDTLWHDYSNLDENGKPSYTGSWPESGEIDIFEQIPGNANYVQANLWSYSGSSLGVGNSPNIDTSEWHIYACEWTEEYIVMFIDDIEYKRWTFSDYSETTIQSYKNQPMHILLNLAIGFVGGTPPSDITEMKMYIDWVRVYEPIK